MRTTVAALMIVSACTVTPGADAAARPDLQLPVPCGETWQTYTHDDHADPDKIDMVPRGSPALGKPVLASQGGTVVEAEWHDDAGNVVTLDHGDRWRTRYMHLRESSVRVTVGQTVARGQQIAQVGNTGTFTSGPHLHYEQIHDGVVVRPVLNGVPLARSWYPAATPAVSANCGVGPMPPPTLYYVDTFADAPGRATPGGARTGVLHAGTSYVYCKVKGPTVQAGTAWNTWWLRTDLDQGEPFTDQYVSAYYLSRRGNDVAEDNRGVDIRTC
ncbi:M23 family metallopeptidase [Herbidospora mongoliensis]|uniref:M23 family metallopeptidase n=1 Tax=Herbidospora mongoliensis TaxID=688067 RepID=UPI00082DB517|nr:M23 family metallopeptidase [Herbidospora mongoliensis]